MPNRKIFIRVEYNFYIMYREASVGKRTIAFIIDVILLIIIILKPLTSLLVTDSEFVLDYSFQTIFIAIFSFIIAWFYFSILQYVLGQSVGMILLNLKIENNYLFRCFCRNLFLLPIFPFTILLFVEPVYLFWKKRRLLEELTKTYVVDVGGVRL